MRPILLIAAAVVLVALVGGFIALGVFPPPPHIHSVDRMLPNDQFQTH